MAENNERLAKLLSTCSNVSLDLSDQRELSSMLEDFLSKDSNENAHETASGVDSDWESDEEATETEDFPDSNDTDDEDDTPLVNVEVECEEVHMEQDVHAVDDGGMLQNARTRCCKKNGQGCKQIRVQAKEGDPRQGCLTQFDPEEIVALQLSIQDMSRGESYL